MTSTVIPILELVVLVVFVDVLLIGLSVSV